MISGRLEAFGEEKLDRLEDADGTALDVQSATTPSATTPSNEVRWSAPHSSPKVFRGRHMLGSRAGTILLGLCGPRRRAAQKRCRVTRRRRVTLASAHMP